LGALVCSTSPERVVERKREKITFAEARGYFVDHEADLMPDFEYPVPGAAPDGSSGRQALSR
jgi:hypothetical protein